MSSLKDKTGQFDIALILYTFGFVIACIKLFLSGIVWHHVSFSSFTGADFAMVIGALGAVYTARKHSDGMLSMKKEKDSTDNGTN